MRWLRAPFTLGLILAALAAPADAERPRRHPLTGRVIAGVMGAAGADWLDRAEREQEEAPARAIDLLGLWPGMVVADIGAGTGYYTTRLAARVGPAGRVYATDIQPEMLDILRRKLEERGLRNVETIEGEQDDPRLPAGAIDLALLVDVYHELAEPQRMLRRIRAALKPTGRLALVEFKKEDLSVPIRPEHKMSVAEVKTEVEAEGFRLEKAHSELPWQHLIVFTVAESERSFALMRQPDRSDCNRVKRPRLRGTSLAKGPRCRVDRNRDDLAWHRREHGHLQRR